MAKGIQSKYATALVALGIFLVSTTSANADIVQASGGNIDAWVPANPNPIGQSFTATVNEVLVDRVSFFWSPSNPGLPDPTVTANLYDGLGYGGTLLGTTSIGPIIDSTPSGFLDATFSLPVALIASNVYTVQFTASPANASGGYGWAGGTNPYSGGVMFDSVGNAQNTSDLRFRVLAVPEPTSLGLLAAGAVMMLRRRKH